MSGNKEIIIELWQKWSLGRSSEQENQTLLLLLENDGNLTNSFLQELWQQSAKGNAALPNQEEQVQFILKHFPADNNTEAAIQKAVHRIHFLKTTWFRYAAAILLMVTAIALYYNFFRTSSSETTVVQNVPPILNKQDISPGFNRAVLTLSNGQKIELDSAASEIIKDGTLSIENNNGQLIYKKGDLTATNTMTTPKGGQYQLTLADGTKVWLNAASSITYPTVFKEKKREVSITGEAYFEVKADAAKPFIVKTGDGDIIVLGTSFNVNTYEDEPAMKASLVEGSVRINDKILVPGQAYLKGKVVLTNVSQDIAWKNGIFYLDGLSAEAALRQLARWYDVDIVYDGKIPRGTLGGRMGRNLTLQQVLKGLDGIIATFRLEGRTLHVGSL